MKKSLLFFTILILGGIFAAYAQNVTVTFRANMSVKIRMLQFDPAKDTILVSGNFNGWSTKLDVMKRISTSDSMWVVSIDTFKVGQQLAFKFVLKGVYEDGNNRELTVPAGGTTYTGWYNNDSVYKPVGTGNILFNVDMSVMQEVGLFNPTKDSMSIRGTFNSWNDDKHNLAWMNQDPLTPSSYSIIESFVNSTLNDTTPYKYFVRLAKPKTHGDSLWTDGYERPLSSGGGNRGIPFLGQPTQDAGLVYYDDVRPDWVITAGKNIAITFQVDMTPATDSLKQAIPFDPANDKVYWVSEEPAFARTQMWDPVKDSNRTFLLTAGQNNIWSGTLNIKAPSFNAFEYRYRFYHTATKEWIWEPDALGTNFVYRVRFIPQTAPRTFTQPYTAPKDTWTNKPVKTDQEPIPVTLVQRGNSIVKTYSLEQNYPNPFNPSTVIRFSIAKAGLVTLKIYDLLGREVMTLINQQLLAGSYEQPFNASLLSSGVYFYTIKSGDFLQSKKMMLVK